MKSIYGQLLGTFMKIGAFTFGGGYAMIGVIEKDCVERRKWITHDEMMDVTVMAESTPGPIAINIATYVGYRQAGFLGALAATFGIVLPSFAVIFVLSSVLDEFLAQPIAAAAFRAIRLAVPVLILDAGFQMVKKMKKTPFSAAVVMLSMLAMLMISFFSLKFSSMSLMVLAGAAGVCAHAVSAKGRGRAK